MKLFIFDCDGTLVDSQHMIVAAMEGAFAAEGLPRPERTAVLDVVGLSLDLAVGKLMPGEPLERIHKTADAYKAAFHELRRNERHQEPLYEGVREALDMLKGRDDVMLGIATGKSRRGLDIVLEREGLRNHFVTLQTSDTHPSKPHPSMIHTAMAETGARPERTLMIGDTTYDMEMAGAAGVAALGVAWGYHAIPDLKRAGAATVLKESRQLGPALAEVLGMMERTV